MGFGPCRRPRSKQRQRHSRRHRRHRRRRVRLHGRRSMRSSRRLHAVAAACGRRRQRAGSLRAPGHLSWQASLHRHTQRELAMAPVIASRVDFAKAAAGLSPVPAGSASGGARMVGCLTCSCEQTSAARPLPPPRALLCCRGCCCGHGRLMLHSCWGVGRAGDDSGWRAACARRAEPSQRLAGGQRRCAIWAALWVAVLPAARIWGWHAASRQVMGWPAWSCGCGGSTAAGGLPNELQRAALQRAQHRHGRTRALSSSLAAPQ